MQKDFEINRKKKYYRLFEIMPGALTWGAFIFPAILSLFVPKIVASLIIVYAVYWLYKAFNMSYRLILAYRRYKMSVETNWLESCQRDISEKKLNSLYHLIILTTYKEEFETVDRSIKAVVDSNYSMERVIFVLGIEERDKKNAWIIAKQLEKKYGNNFYHFMITEHPMGVVGEVKGKGSNMTFAGREALKFIQNKKLSPQNVIVTNLDADNRMHREYLPYLTYKYLTVEDPLHKSFQPLPMYFNNIWKVPIFIRSISVGGSFWQMIESTRPHRMRNFSAHAQSLEALIETDFWSTKSIVEDGHQFWRSYFAFNGNHKIVPILVPVYHDAVLSPKGYWATFKEQYIQKRRWAWGCSDIPYVITNVIGNNRLPKWEKWIHTLRLIEGHFSWSTTSIILAFIGWMPRLLNHSFQATVFSYNFPTIYSRILTVSTFCLIITLIISTLLLPPNRSKKMSLSVFLEWIISPIMLPISNIVYGSIAAIDAQTRLMWGKYLEFKVTEKAPYYDSELK